MQGPVTRRPHDPVDEHGAVWLGRHHLRLPVHRGVQFRRPVALRRRHLPDVRLLLLHLISGEASFHIGRNCLEVPPVVFFLTPCCWLSLQTSANTLVVVSIFRFVAVCKPEISESEFYDFLHCVPSDGHQAANIPLHGTVFCTLMGVQAKMWINNNKSVEL